MPLRTCFSFPCGCNENKGTSSTRTVEIEQELSGVYNVHFYTYKELKIATENFSSANKIGAGGFGSVYKGKLRDGTMAAIKVLSPESKQGLKEFLAELTVLADVEHENLVKLYGCCVEEHNRILVSGYLENNSLAQTLLGRNRNNINFSWRTRRKICIDIAKGLAYLHEEVCPHIVHRDIKAGNVLLDKDLTAKISDFGLAKLIPDSMSHISTTVAGTLGYLAPEYAMQAKLTRKADVYSFGVLLLEIVCGRSNTSKFLSRGYQYLLEMAWEMYERGDLLDIIDESCRCDLNSEETYRFLKIALLCTQHVPKIRPSMPTVVKMLQGEEDITAIELLHPGLLSKSINAKANDDPEGRSYMESSSQMSSGNTVHTISFTSINDRSR